MLLKRHFFTGFILAREWYSILNFVGGKGSLPHNEDNWV